ncbi:hypothetical protein LCDVSa035R [Lymphocystis disease virus 3]|uniref:Uncharacterized protein n=1 Tax=Lymphocystis disease virus 3 TaxID=2560566 RepID=A0A1B2RVU8_9VIRU|nr:hypothetical protein BZK12_gp035 [Lymphocystis disease virus Sa]AOC55119.1 hypothetical protein LCDVSa035R [Lymphocystis disease virus 3]
MDFKKLLVESLKTLTADEFDYFKFNLQIIVPFVKVKRSLFDLTKKELTDLLWIGLGGNSFTYVLSALKAGGFISRYDKLHKNLTDVLFCLE